MNPVTTPSPPVTTRHHGVTTPPPPVTTRHPRHHRHRPLPRTTYHLPAATGNGVNLETTRTPSPIRDRRENDSSRNESGCAAATLRSSRFGGVCGLWQWSPHDHDHNRCTNHHNPNFDRQLLLVRRESAGVQECTGVILWTSLCRRNVSTFV